MKLTNKIILLCLALLLAFITIHKVVVLSKTEVVPNVFAKGFADTIITRIGFSSLEVKGSYIVEVIRDTATEARFEAPRILLNNYTSISNDSKTLRISATLDMSKFWHDTNVRIKGKTLEKIRASSGAVIILKGFEGEALDVKADDSSVVMCSKCNFNESKIAVSGKALISMNKTRNASVDLRNSGRLALTLNGGILEGIMDPESVLLTDGTLTQNKIKKNKLN